MREQCYLVVHRPPESTRASFNRNLEFCQPLWSIKKEPFPRSPAFVISMCSPRFSNILYQGFPPYHHAWPVPYQPHSVKAAGIAQTELSPLFPGILCVHLPSYWDSSLLRGAPGHRLKGLIDMHLIAATQYIQRSHCRIFPFQVLQHSSHVEKILNTGSSNCGQLD